MTDLTPSPTRIVLTLSRPFPLLNRTLRTHFAQRRRHKLALQAEIHAAVLGQRAAVPYPYARVTIERHSVGNPDADGLWGGSKDLLDCLTTPVVQAKGKVRNPYGLGLIVDDAARYCDLRVIHVAAATRSAQRTVVVIERMEPPQ